MGFFSLFRTKDPEKVAAELVAAALSLETSPLEQEWIDRLGITPHRYISERNALRVCMTEAGVNLAFVDGVRHTSFPRARMEVALTQQFLDFFAAMPNVTSDEGRAYYRRLSGRYILRTPAEMAILFHYYLFNPEAWRDWEQEVTPTEEMPDGFQSFVHQIMRESMKSSLERAQGLEG